MLCGEIIVKKIIAALLSIIVCLAALIAIGGIGKLNNKQTNKIEVSRDHRNKREKEICRKIQTEIKFLFDHDWAGDYFLGDGLGNISLLLAPESGYALVKSGDLGLWVYYYGAVSETNGRIRLAVNNKRIFGNGMKMYEGIAEEFIVIPWGSRKYLVPADNMIGLCNAVNEGVEPRKSVFGRFLLRRGDEKMQVHGFPNIPQEFRGYLLEKPIEGEIVAVGAPETRSKECEPLKFIVTLNVGKEQGLLPGMELYLSYNPDNIFRPVRIIKVEDEKSEGVITQAREKSNFSLVGRWVSTSSNK
jgi:hypothetical protein